MIKKIVDGLSAIKWAYLTKDGREYRKQQKIEQEGIKSSCTPDCQDEHHKHEEEVNND